MSKLSWGFGLSAVVAAVSFVGTTMSTNINLSSLPFQPGVERVAGLNNNIISTIVPGGAILVEDTPSTASITTPPMQWFGASEDQTATKVANDDSITADVKSWMAPHFAPKGLASVDGGSIFDSYLQPAAPAPRPTPGAELRPKVKYHSARVMGFNNDKHTKAAPGLLPSPLESMGSMMSQLQTEAQQVANPFQQADVSQQKEKPWFSFGQVVPPPKAQNPMSAVTRPFQNAAKYFQNNPLKALIPIGTATACAVYAMIPKDPLLDRKEHQLMQQTGISAAGSRPDRFYELVLGSLYEAEDLNSNWWRIRIDGWNQNGSYRAVVIGLEGESLSVWHEVWPENCRLQEEDQQHVKHLAEACRQTRYNETPWYVA